MNMSRLPAGFFFKGKFKRGHPRFYLLFCPDSYRDLTFVQFPKKLIC